MAKDSDKKFTLDGFVPIKLVRGNITLTVGSGLYTRLSSCASAWIDGAQCIKVLYNRKTNTLALQPAKQSEEGSVRIAQNRCVMSEYLTEFLRKKLKIDKSEKKVIQGFYEDDVHSLIFELK